MGGGTVNRQLVLKELWDDLDSCMYRLMTDGRPKTVPEYSATGSAIEHTMAQYERHSSEWQAYGKEQGFALGLALAIAKIDNLGEPDIEAVRREAVRRWEASVAADIK